MSEFPKLYGESALPEPSLSELYGQLAQMMRSLERMVLAWDANVMASEGNFARFGQFLAQNEQCHEDMQESPIALTTTATTAVQQDATPTMAQPLGAIQSQEFPYHMGTGQNRRTSPSSGASSTAGRPISSNREAGTASGSDRPDIKY